MKSVVLLSLLAIAITGTATYYYYNQSSEIFESEVADEDLHKGFEWDQEAIKSIDLSKRVTHKELEEKYQQTSLKMNRLMQSAEGNPEKLEFFGKVLGFVTSKVQSLTRAAIPAYNLVKNTLDTISTVVHDTCNPEGAIEGFFARIIKRFTPYSAQICYYNQYYGKYSDAIGNFANNVSSIISKLTGNSFSYQYVSEGQARQILFSDLEGLYGSLGARLQCIEAAKELRTASYYLAQQLEYTLDRNTCTSGRNCSSVSSLDFDSYDPNWSLDSEFNDIGVLAQIVAQKTQFVEYCKYAKHYFSEADLQ